jgi:Domain of unknown function (DUF5122) beta-propeller
VRGRGIHKLQRRAFATHRAAECVGTLLNPPFGGAGFGNTVDVITRIPATGELYVGGSYHWFDTVTAVGIVRLNADGSLD